MSVAPPTDFRDPREAEPEVPSSVEAEQSLLGSIIYEPHAHRLITVELSSEHFYEPLHGRLWRSIIETIREGETPEVTFLSEEFRRDPAFVEMGAIQYLIDLVDRAPPAERANQFAAHIVDMHNRRRLIDLSASLSAMARKGADPDGTHVRSVAILDYAEAELKKIQLAAPTTHPGVTTLQSAEKLLDDIEMEVSAGRPSGVRTGLSCVDDRLGGLIPSWLVTIGGRPGMGKSALVRNIMYGAARANPRRLFAMFSLEMPHRELSERALSAATAEAQGADLGLRGTQAIEFYKFTRAKILPTEFPELRDYAAAMPGNLFIDDRSGISVSDIRRAVWALKAKGDLAAISVDYLQLMKRAETRGRNDAALIGDITQALKALATEAKICVILVSQLNRNVEGRDDKRPQLADLRESGSIEQDSNVVMLVYRAAYYLARTEPQEGTTAHEEWVGKMAAVQTELEVITAKLRQGSVGTDKQEYHPAFDLIRDWRR